MRDSTMRPIANGHAFLVAFRPQPSTATGSGNARNPPPPPHARKRKGFASPPPRTQSRGATRNRCNVQRNRPVRPSLSPAPPAALPRARRPATTADDVTRRKCRRRAASPSTSRSGARMVRFEALRRGALAHCGPRPRAHSFAAWRPTSHSRHVAQRHARRDPGAAQSPHSLHIIPRPLPAEDAALVAHVNEYLTVHQHPPGAELPNAVWKDIATKLGRDCGTSRNVKQCRERCVPVGLRGVRGELRGARAKCAALRATACIPTTAATRSAPRYSPPSLPRRAAYSHPQVAQPARPVTEPEPVDRGGGREARGAAAPARQRVAAAVDAPTRPVRAGRRGARAWRSSGGHCPSSCTPRWRCPRLVVPPSSPTSHCRLLRAAPTTP